MSDQLFDVVAVRTLDNGGKIRAPICGPLDEVDARYHAKRLKSISFEQDYIVVVHHRCEKCLYLSLIAQPAELSGEREAAIREAWNQAEAALFQARSSGDATLITQALALVETLSDEAAARAVEAATEKSKAKALADNCELTHTCSRYYNEAEAV